MINFLANTLTLIGALLLAAALLRIHRLAHELTASNVARRWYLLGSFIVLFILAYLGYTFVFWSHRDSWHDMMIPLIFFFGALFVWLVSALALQTVQDMRRVSLLEHETITDSLTGLYNRRYLDRRISEEFARAQRYAHPLSVLMLDIDHFKQINDTYGHQAGDLALNFLGKLILDSSRETDIAARYGGEEIAVIAASSTLKDTRELAERLRRQIEAHELKLATADKRRRSLHMTVSIGVASFTPQMESAEQFIQCADKALYAAKEAGRNQVSAFTDTL